MVLGDKAPEGFAVLVLVVLITYLSSLVGGITHAAADAANAGCCRRCRIKPKPTPPPPTPLWHRSYKTNST